MFTGQQVSKVCLQLFNFFKSNSYFPLRLIIDSSHSQNSTHFFLNPQSARGLAVAGGGGLVVVVVDGVVDGVVDVVVDIVVVGGVGVVHSACSANALSNINRISSQILSRVLLSRDGKSFNFCFMSFVIFSARGLLRSSITCAFSLSSVVVSLSAISITSSSSMLLCARVRQM